MFRFTIRDVLWLTVVVAMGCAWFCDHRRLTVPRWDVNSDFDGLPPGSVWIEPIANQSDPHSNIF